MTGFSAAQIRSAAEGFWRRAGGYKQYGEPVDIERAIVRTLPLAIERIANLTSSDVTDFLSSVGMPVVVCEPARELRACLAADTGVGFILLDSSDAEEEQRLSLAHELAHFLLHYLAPREQALSKLGSSFVAVLDRSREPTKAELFSSALRDVPIEPYRHSMARTGIAQHTVTTMERDAEELAVELIVPSAVIGVRPTLDTQAIVRRFGVPLSVANQLDERLRTRSTTTIGVGRLFGSPR
jgi:Zn-dependent peptidase ImmA (M78 family)